MADLATQRGVPVFDFVLDLATREALRTKFRAAAANTDIEIVTELLTTPGAVLGLSDAGAHVGQVCDARTAAGSDPPSRSTLTGSRSRSRSTTLSAGLATSLRENTDGPSRARAPTSRSRSCS